MPGVRRDLFTRLSVGRIRASRQKFIRSSLKALSVRPQEIWVRLLLPELRGHLGREINNVLSR
jgi:hypothetical protein